MLQFLLILSSVFQTPEFYVIVSVVAAAVIAAVSLPERKGEVKLHLLAGELHEAGSTLRADTPGSGSVTFTVGAGNVVTLRRDGLSGVALDGALSLAVKVSGFDITIEERVTAGSSCSPMAASATFELNFLAPEWYHIRYESETFSEHASLTLHVREGITLTKRLIH
ncbi:MAG: hypothetical protein K2J10_05185 [Muribaculaceae bacterium]|nr:hypothetical protein [Muribaculaceae bacterium]